jgi:hypothetical protein
MGNNDPMTTNPLSALDVLQSEIWSNHILPFVGVGSYRYVAGTNRQLRKMYTELFPMEKTTHVLLSSSQAALALQEVGEENRTVLCPMAARGGGLEALQFLLVDRNCQWAASTCAAAARGGHLPVVQWASQHGCPWNDHVVPKWGQITEFLKGNRRLGPWEDDTCAVAAERGYLHIVQWAWANGFRMSRYMTIAAARNGHLQTLMWLRAIGCQWDS